MLKRFGERRDWQIALVLTCALRIVWSVAAAAMSFLVRAPEALIRSNALTQNLPAPGTWHYAILGVWQRFDTLWYLHIAQHGYDRPAAVVFYPLYPLIIRVLSPIAGGIGSALLVSTVASFFLLWGVLRLKHTELPDAAALRAVGSGSGCFVILSKRFLRSEGSGRSVRSVAHFATQQSRVGIASLTNLSHYRAVWLLALLPTSFILFAGYTESLAIALVVWSILFAQRERWSASAVCGFAAGLTRSMGALVIVPLAIMAWRSRKLSRWWIALGPAGTLGYWAWLRSTGRPSVAAAYRYWNTDIAAPWTTVWRALMYLTHKPDVLVAINLGALTLFTVAGVSARRRVDDRFFAASVVAQILMRACVPPLTGAFRYVLPIYPAFMTFGQWASGIKRSRFVLLCIGLLALNLAWMWAFLSWSLVL
jgi:hypothetical protein